ncbi:MAG: SIS domain-containing protein [Acidimicrobiales bacterium]|nr:SIS domain-containing protein [Acidimicrobiales bacterium]
MCGIIGLVRRPATRPVPTSAELVALLDQADAELHQATPLSGELTAETATHLAEVAIHLEAANGLLMGVPGLQCLLADAALVETIRHRTDVIEKAMIAIEDQLDHSVIANLEATNASMIRVKDAAWSLHRDRLRTAHRVAELAPAETTASGLATYLSIQEALSGIDRLEVRGRDSAGLHLLVRDHALDLGDPATQAAIDARADDPLFMSGSVRLAAGGVLSFVYKAAAEIGELGDNTAALRQAITNDELLHRAVANDTAQTTVLGHTRWASVGIISEPNCHPLNSDRHDGEELPYCTAVLNGDVDNFADLIAAEGLSIVPEISTDAKVIPALMSTHLAAGHDVTESFRRSVAVMEGSVAIGASGSVRPERLQLALRGSGQGVYIGLADDCFIVASEPYGVVELTSRFVRMDGETPGNPENPNASRGQIIDLDGLRAGDLAGIVRKAYDGTDLPVTEADVITAQITTRDIDRGDAPHYLLKEISEAPNSFRKTLRGKLVDADDGLRVELGPETLPTEVRQRLIDSEPGRGITEILVIGQGTAAVAGESLAAVLRDDLAGRSIRVEATPATELSGFAMRADMSNTLVVAISQSGTTTDTNRTVDLVRGRGAAVLAIVNRRNSDLTDKADGVLYTSDGRDVEMSVASTKAFYAQIAAGLLLADQLVELLTGEADRPGRAELLQGMRDLPAAMEATIALRGDIARVAGLHAPQRRYWAVVGNGLNHIAARELRIKLSELCYKSIAVDFTEDKKHIDLSAEPMIIVCAAGLEGSTADDVAKEVAIYRAHKAAPIVIASDGQTRFGSALDAIMVPAVHPRLAFVLSTVVGHLFGYEAARAIDALAGPLRAIRAELETLASGTVRSITAETILREVRPTLRAQSVSFFSGLRDGSYNGVLEASTAVRISQQLRFALGSLPLEAYQTEFGKVGTPSAIVEDLLAALTAGVDELTRPIDAIKHQAKTVTVGISRSDETLLEATLAAAVLESGAPRDRLSYRSLRTLADLDPAVAEVLGYSRYRVEGSNGSASVVIVDQGGIARNIRSRTERDPALRGNKRRVASEQRLLVTTGASDNRTVILVPEVKDNETVGITLLHVRFHDDLSAEAARGVLQGYRNRYAALRDAVTETEPTFREDLLASVPVVDLLTADISELAQRWRS